jgi:hypothetical protein
VVVPGLVVALLAWLVSASCASVAALLPPSASCMQQLVDCSCFRQPCSEELLLLLFHFAAGNLDSSLTCVMHAAALLLLLLRCAAAADSSLFPQGNPPACVHVAAALNHNALFPYCLLLHLTRACARKASRLRKTSRLPALIWQQRSTTMSCSRAVCCCS